MIGTGDDSPLVEADPELSIDPRDNGPHFTLWLARSEFLVLTTPGWFPKNSLGLRGRT